MHPIRRAAAAFAAAGLAAALVAPATAHADPVEREYYLSVGDSYATGYQPGGMTTKGFANQVVRKAKKKGYALDLVNVGCAGATTTSVLRQKGCAQERLAVGAKSYGRLTQVAAATKFLRRNRGRVALVTVSVGGNDVTACATASEPVACVADASARIRESVGALARKLRRAAGPKVTIVGTTYPDVLLGQWVRPPVNKQIAELSVLAFRSLINPALAAAYQAVGGKFADVTAASGAYGPLTRTTRLAPYGTVPVPVAKLCRLTWYCDKGDIHARDRGYSLIADLVVRELPRHR